MGEVITFPQRSTRPQIIAHHGGSITVGAAWLEDEDHPDLLKLWDSVGTDDAKELARQLRVAMAEQADWRKASAGLQARPL